VGLIEIAIWSACLGVYFSYTLLSIFFAATYRRPQVLNIAVFIGVSFVAIFLASGLGKLVWPDVAADNYQRATLLVMGISTSLSAYGLRSFLRAAYRDRWINWGMSAAAGAAALTLLGALWPTPLDALELQAVVVIAVAVFSASMSLRAWLSGDRYALPMLTACIALVFAISGLYATALAVPLMTAGMQALTAFLCAAYVVISFLVLRRRHGMKVRMLRRLDRSNDKDLLTQTWTGTALIRKIDEAIVRAKRQKKELTVLGIDFSNAMAVKQVHGAQGLDEVIYTMAMRINHLCGNDLVGRYGNYGFVVVLESVRNKRVLRSLGLRMALNLRRPYLIDPEGKDDLFNAEIGIGIARLSRKWSDHGAHHASDTELGGYDSLSAAQDVLHEAFELAVTARQFRSRTAILSSESRQAVALESMSLR
jgi:diguanylate cyclase (GGDEF)-like protein